MTGTSDTGNSASRSGSRPSRMAYRRRYRLQVRGHKHFQHCIGTPHAQRRRLRAPMIGCRFGLQPSATPALCMGSSASFEHPPWRLRGRGACCRAVLFSMSSACSRRQLRSHAAPEHVLRGGAGAADLDGDCASAAGKVLRAVPAGQEARLLLCASRSAISERAASGGDTGGASCWGGVSGVEIQALQPLKHSFAAERP
jgi:hypothetical protein